MKRLMLLVSAVVVMVLIGHGPALADPAVPTHFRSVVETIDGPVGSGFSVEILGGDAFVVITAGGAAVEIPGYEGEPYVRIAPSGLVEVNERSPARWLNDARYGARDVAVPSSADAAAPPHWVPVAVDGSWAWHDHRVHYMAPNLPRNVDPTLGEVQEIFDWQLPLVVDGASVVVHGRLTWVPGPSGSTLASWFSAVLIASVLLAWLAAQLRHPGMVMVTATGIAAVVAAVASTGRLVGLPEGAEGDPRGLVLAAAALLVTLGVTVTRRITRSPILAATALAPLVAWIGLSAPVLVRPVAPNVMPIGVVRAAVLTTVVLVIVGAVTLARSTFDPAGRRSATRREAERHAP